MIYLYYKDVPVWYFFHITNKPAFFSFQKNRPYIRIDMQDRARCLSPPYISVVFCLILLL